MQACPKVHHLDVPAAPPDEVKQEAAVRFEPGESTRCVASKLVRITSQGGVL
jgi:hypothetical protein